METQTCSSHMQNKNKTCTYKVQCEKKKVKRPHFVPLMPFSFFAFSNIPLQDETKNQNDKNYHNPNFTEEKHLLKEKLKYFFVSSGRLN